MNSNAALKLHKTPRPTNLSSRFRDTAFSHPCLASDPGASPPTSTLLPSCSHPDSLIWCHVHTGETRGKGDRALTLGHELVGGTRYGAVHQLRRLHFQLLAIEIDQAPIEAEKFAWLGVFCAIHEIELCVWVCACVYARAHVCA